jgi:hypothetical protein
MDEGRSEERRKWNSQSGEHNWVLILALIALLPVFPALPGFLIVRFLARHERAKQIEDKQLWIAVIALAGVGVTLYLLVALGVIANVFLSFILLLPLVASGLPAGVLYERLADRRWAAILPLCIASVIAVIVFVLSVAFFYAPGPEAP